MDPRTSWLEALSLDREYPPDEWRFATDAELLSLPQTEEFVKYDLLLRFGGVFFDSRIECIQTIEPLLEDIDSFWTYEQSGELSGTVIGVAPSHPLISMMVRDVQLGLCSGGSRAEESCQALRKRAVCEYLGNHQSGLRLELADTGRELGGLYRGKLAIFNSWVFLQRADTMPVHQTTSPDHFGVDHRSASYTDELSNTVAPVHNTMKGTLWQPEDPDQDIVGTTQPCIAIVIPTLNRGDLLQSSVEALLPQLSHVECIFIIDNGRQALKFDSPKVTVTEMPVNLGVAASWNHGIRKAMNLSSVSHVLVLNDDICLGPTQVSDILTVIRERPPNLVFCGPLFLVGMGAIPTVCVSHGVGAGQSVRRKLLSSLF